MLLSILVFIASAAGIAGFFCEVPVLIVIGGIAYILETISGLITGELRSLTTTVVTVVIAGIISGVAHYNILLGICFGLCIESIILGLLSILMLLLSQRH